MPQNGWKARAWAVRERGLYFWMAALAIGASGVLAVTVRLYQWRILDRRQVRAGVRLAEALNRHALRLLRKQRGRRANREQ